MALRSGASGSRYKSRPRINAAAAHRTKRNIQPRRNFCGWLGAIIFSNVSLCWADQAPRISLTFFAARKAKWQKRLKNFVDFFRQHKVVVADTFYAVRVQVNDHLVPHVEPFGVMVHRFGDQRDPRHVAERADKIFAREFPVQLAVDDAPAFRLGSSAAISASESFLAGMTF